MSVSLNIGLKGLLTAQSALETVGHNVSNANTPGYSRQQVDIRAGRPMDLRGLLVGSGVEATGVRRIADDVLNSRLVGQSGVVARYESLLGSLFSVESLLSEPGGAGIGASMDGFFESVSGLSNDPGDTVLRNGLVENATALTASFQSLARSIDDQAADQRNQLEVLAVGVNVLGEEVAKLNVEISKIEAGGGRANDLRDQRDLALIKLSDLVEIDPQVKPSGVVHVLIEGQLLVGTSQSYDVGITQSDEGTTQLRLSGGTRDVEPQGGRIGGILRFLQNYVPDFQDQIDSLANTMALEVNRAHSVGTPEDGGFKTLTGTSVLVDPLGGGSSLASPLASLNLPFNIKGGELRVNLSEDSTGELRTHRVAIDPGTMTVQDLLDDLNSIPDLTANLDSLGRLVVRTDTDHRFDFSSRLDNSPDDAGSFGSSQATLTTPNAGPFALANGDTLDLSGSLGAFTVALNAGDFEDIAAATAEELAAVINADPTAAANQITADVADGRLVLQSVAEGAAAQFDVVAGTALASLGLQAGTTVNGSNNSVRPQLSGSYEGDTNQVWSFRPSADGVVGSTPGLQVEVVNALGQPVATLDVGEGYVPGTDLDLGSGVSVSFNFGELSSTHGDVMDVDLSADSDSADLLVGLGINSFFSGNTADSFAVNQAILDDPQRIAASATGADGDNGALLDMLRLQTEAVGDTGVSVTGAYGGFVSDVGSSVSTVETRLVTEISLNESLQARREAVSGVNVDEELVDLIRFEQAFTASARFLSVVQQLGDTLLQLL
ncbi:MAG: flagellar hook-associated protein FlgK [Planctomycetota bacterium]|jgi:flagellar hook-associated protein FlgK